MAAVFAKNIKKARESGPFFCIMDQVTGYDRTPFAEAGQLELNTNTFLPIALPRNNGEPEIATVGDAVRFFSELSDEQKETAYWRVAIHTLRAALKEPTYLAAATLNLQTALIHAGMLAEPATAPDRQVAARP